MESPDKNSIGFLNKKPNHLRYDFRSTDVDDVAMKITKLIKPNSKVLDVGCGTGVIAEILKEYTNADVIGIEPDEERVKKALEKNIVVYNDLLTESFFKEHGQFDYIIFADVLEHLENPSEILKIAKKGLKENGSIIASVPNVAHWFVRIDLLFGNFNYQDCGIMDATHLRWFTRKTIQSFFQTIGFKIEKIDYTININLPDYKVRIPWRWLPLHVSKRIVRLLAKISSGLFGCQFVIKVTLP
ncbi:MAG: class I SAM-dependent methyltransferase [Prolixibacteraceae bacterium]|jgi:methionine biosynthesis protein MetW|nr:class I SAM-dependent methyltransferase [Prolixibacteraceae bacterium]